MLETDSKQTGGKIISADKGKLVIEGYLQYNFRYSAQGWPLQGGGIWEEVRVRTDTSLGEELARGESKHKVPKWRST